MTSFLFASVALATLALLCPLLLSRRSARVDRERWVAAQWILLLAWMYSVLPGLVQYLLYGRHQTSVALSSVSTPSLLSSLVALALSSCLVLVCILTVIRGLRERPSWPVGTLVCFLLPWISLSVLSALHSGSTITRQIVVFPLIALALWVTSPRVTDVLRLFGGLTIGTAVVSLGLALVRPQAAAFYYAVGSGTADKTVFSNKFLLAGVYTHPNQLGVVLALGVPTILLLRSRLTRVVGLLLVVTALVWAGSRTSLVAGGVALVLALVVSQRRNRRWLLKAAAVSGLALVVVTPLVTNTPAAFAQRGQIWIGSLARVPEMLLLGGGPDFYLYQLGVASDIGRYGAHGHNVLVNTVTVGGIVGVIALSIFFLLAFRAAELRLDRSVIPLAYLVGLVFISWLEVPFSFSSLGAFGYAVLIPLAAIVFSGPNTVLKSDGPDPHAHRSSHPNVERLVKR